MVHRGKLYYTVGLPRSGKSTWCDQWVRQPICNPLWDVLTDCPATESISTQEGKLWAEPKLPRAVIAGDDFRRALHGNSYRIEAEATVFAMMDVATRALLDRGFDVIIDETCTTEQTLLRYLRLDRAAVPVFIDTPKDVCIERAREAGKEYLAGPIERMATQLATLRDNWNQTVGRLRDYLHSRESQDVAV
jgi:predicted kinase